MQTSRIVESGKRGGTMILLLVLAFCLATAGCSSSLQGSYSFGLLHKSRKGPTRDKPQGGGAGVFTHDKVPFAMMIVDGATNESGASMTSSGVEGSIGTVDGRSVVYKGWLTAKNAGTVVIDGTNYDLAKGNVFLVDAKSAPNKVEQISWGKVAQIPPAASMIEMLKSSDNPKIAEAAKVVYPDTPAP